MLNRGVIITKGQRHWQIYQQQDGRADIALSGKWYSNAPEGAAITVFARVVNETTGAPVVGWVKCEVTGGEWHGVIPAVPAGGLYRVETKLDFPGSDGNSIIRGDMVNHIGVGDLYVIAGQSNASGRAGDPIADGPELGVHVMRNSGLWDLASHPLNDTTDALPADHLETNNPSHSPWLWFAKRLKAELNIPIGLLQTSQGGCGLWQYNPEEEGSLYRNMLRIVRDFAPDGVRGVLWYQGCADGHVNMGSTYLARFRAMVEHTRRDLGQPDLPFLTVQLNRCTAPTDDEHDRSWGMVRDAQRRAAHEIPHVTVVPANDSALYDYIHNSASANLVIGERVANAALDMIYGRSRVWQAPEVKKAVQVGPREVMIDFSHITNWINPFEVGVESFPITVEDEAGRNPLAAYEIVGTDRVRLTTSRDIAGKTVLHGAWQMNPGHLIPCDCARMPMLSFYGVAVE